MEKTGPMGLLPCIRRGSLRWWLPRSAEVTEGLAIFLIDAGRVHPDQSQAVIESFARLIESDPPLLIHAAVRIDRPNASTFDLAKFLLDEMPGSFARGDAFLASPTLDGPTRQRFAELDEQFRSLPVERWIDEASAYLEILGPEVSSTWRSSWPSITPSINGRPGAAASDSPDPLQQIARTAAHRAAVQHGTNRRLQRSKMQALRELAYGLSHEINNPLANISTRAQGLMRGEADPSRRETLQRIVDQVYRAHQMIADLMFFASPPDTNFEPTDLAALVGDETSSFQDEAARLGIRLEVAAPEGPLVRSVDAAMIGEAIAVLIRNAIEAIGTGGTVVVSLVESGDEVLIHVADSGPGLSEEAKRHAFDPYFSGREAGRGLGLGLCRAYRITQLHHAEISLAAAPAGCVATIRI